MSAHSSYSYSQDLPSDDVYGDGTVPSNRNRPGVNITSLLASVGPTSELDDLEYVLSMRIERRRVVTFQRGNASLVPSGAGTSTGTGTATASAHSAPAWSQALSDDRIPISDVAVMAALSPDFQNILTEVSTLVAADPNNQRARILRLQLETLDDPVLSSLREETRLTTFRFGDGSATRPSGASSTSTATGTATASLAEARARGHQRNQSVFLTPSQTFPLTLPEHLVYGNNVTAEESQPTYRQ